MLILGKTQKKHQGTSHPRYQTCPSTPRESKEILTLFLTCTVFKHACVIILNST